MSRAEAATLLGVAESVTAADLQRAFARAARRTHPDAMPGASDAERGAAAERFDRLVRARAVLTDSTPSLRSSPSGATAPRSGQAGTAAGRARHRPRGSEQTLVLLAALAFAMLALVAMSQVLHVGAFAPAATPLPTP